MKAANAKAGATDKDKYFRGDELPGPTVKASLTPTTVPALTPAEAATH